MADVINPGSTPLFTFEFPAETLAMFTRFEVAFSIKEDDTVRPLFVKRGDECVVGTDEISVQLYEEDTLQFPEKKTIRVQVRARSDGFPRGVSDVMYFRSGELDREGAFDE